MTRNWLFFGVEVDLGLRIISSESDGKIIHQEA